MRITSLTRTIAIYVHNNTTCMELFDKIHHITTIPLEAIRITKGSMEVYPNHESLPCMESKQLFLTLKLRLLGGMMSQN